MTILARWWAALLEWLDPTPPRVLPPKVVELKQRAERRKVGKDVNRPHSE